MKKIINFLNSVNKELGKVRWSTRKEFTNYVIATIIFILVFALFFTSTDMLLAFLKKVIG